MAISTICCSATERSPTSAPGSRRRPSRSSNRGCSAQRAAIDEAAAARLAADEDVLGDRHVRDEIELLVDGRDAEPLRLVRLGQRDRRALESRSCRRPAPRRRTGSSAGSTCRRRSRRAGPGIPRVDLDETSERLHAGKALADPGHAQQRHDSSAVTGEGWVAGSHHWISRCPNPLCPAECSAF